MTRINCVPVETLHQKHLVAEYKELPRTFNLVRKAIERGEKPDLFGSYTMGTGHVRFFYPRLKYLADRQKQLIAEMINRGYNPTYTSCLEEEYKDIPKCWWNDWKPTSIDIKINQDRINLRLSEMKK